MPVSAPARFHTNPEDPAPVQAASLALAICGLLRAQTWEHLPGNVFLDDGDDGLKVALTEAQADLLVEFAPVVAHVRPALPGREGRPRQKVLTILWCPECGDWRYFSTGTAPKRCTLRTACMGRVVKAVPAEMVDDSQGTLLPDPTG